MQIPDVGEDRSEPLLMKYRVHMKWVSMDGERQAKPTQFTAGCLRKVLQRSRLARKFPGIQDRSLSFLSQRHPEKMLALFYFLSCIDGFVNVESPESPGSPAGKLAARDLTNLTYQYQG
jgi:hypothetical protein